MFFKLCLDHPVPVLPVPQPGADSARARHHLRGQRSSQQLQPPWTRHPSSRRAWGCACACLRVPHVCLMPACSPLPQVPRAAPVHPEREQRGADWCRPCLPAPARSL